MSDKYCVDCTHYENVKVSPAPWNKYVTECHCCSRELKISMVTKKLNYDKNMLNCLVEREDAMRLEHFRCGVKGRYFELKKI